jgi:hypothetical protein
MYPNRANSLASRQAHILYPMIHAPPLRKIRTGPVGFLIFFSAPPATDALGNSDYIVLYCIVLYNMLVYYIYYLLYNYIIYYEVK